MLLIKWVYKANYGSALAFELRNNDEGETYLRTKFKNGTNEQFRTLHLYGHKEDIALNEFLYRLDVSQVLLFLYRLVDIYLSH